MIDIIGAAPRTNIFDALSKIAQTRQQMAQAKYADPSLKAALLQAQLANQKSQTLLPFVAPHEQATIQDLLAGANLKGQEAKYVPTKYAQEAERLGISQGNLDLQKQINSPERLQALLQATIARAQRDRAISSPDVIKAQQTLREQQAREKQLQNASLNENGEPILSDEQRNAAKEIWDPLPQGKTNYGAYNLYYNKKEGENKGSKLSILSPAMKTQFQKQLVGFENMSSIFPDLKVAASKGVLGYMTPHQNDIYQSFVSMSKEPGIGASQLPKIRHALKTLDDLFVRRKFTTKEDFLEKLAGVERTLTRQRDLTNKIIGRGGIIIPKSGGSHPDQDAIPKFTNESEERNWYINASPEQRILYRQSVQHGGNR